MIYYNFPKRGPFEYDKMILTVLPYYNETQHMKAELENEEGQIKSMLRKIDEQLENIKNQKVAEKAIAILEMMR